MTIELFDMNDTRFNIVKSIRLAVFENEQGAVYEEEFDEYDNSLSSVYALVYDGDSAIATGRIAVTDKGFKIGRIAVTKESRGRGAGAFLVKNLCLRCEALGADRVLVDSQLHAVEFYRKLGFSETGEKEIIDRGIKHLPMERLYVK